MAIKRTWKKPPYWQLGVWLAICWAVAALGGLVTFDSVNTWYPTIEKPSFNPPNWVFGPVWTTLYTFMAIAAWRIRGVAEAENRKWLFIFFWLQLACNGIWSPLFFGWHQIGVALIDMIILWLLIATFTRIAYKQERISFCLFLPYLLWVSFALVLNLQIWLLNR